MESLEDLAFQASMNYLGGDKHDTNWLQDCIIRTQQFGFLKELTRTIYVLVVIFFELEIASENKDDELYELQIAMIATYSIQKVFHSLAMGCW